jgi:hypothetical protein
MTTTIVSSRHETVCFKLISVGSDGEDADETHERPWKRLNKPRANYNSKHSSTTYTKVSEKTASKKVDALAPVGEKRKRGRPPKVTVEDLPSDYKRKGKRARQHSRSPSIVDPKTCGRF